MSCIKGHCRNDFAVSGQLCAKIITLSLNKTKNFCKATAKISNEFYQRGLTIIHFLRIFGTRGIKTRKNRPIISNFNLFPSVQFIATGIISFRIQLM